MGNTICASLVLASLCLLAQPPSRHHAAAKKEAKERTIVVLFMVDRSKSVGDGPPDQMRSVVQHLTALARLSGRPVKLGAVLYNGVRITVIGDDKKAPTANHVKFLTDVLHQWGEAAGATPMDEAFLKARDMLRDLEPADVHLIHFSDGAPYSGRPRPDEFPEVQKYIRERLQAIDTRELPEPIRAEMKERLRRDLDNPDTEEGRKLVPLLLKVEREACVRLAAGLTGKNLPHRVRLITFDFGGGLEALEEIHRAGGGAPRDYLVVNPGDSVIGRLFAAGIGDFPGLVKLQPQNFAPDDTKFEARHEVQLSAKLAEGAVIVAVLKKPLPDFLKHCTFSAAMGGVTVPFEPLPRGEPLALIGLDGKDQAVTFTFAVDPVPNDGKITLVYGSARGIQAVPEITLYVFFRANRELIPEFRPVDEPVDRPGPFTVSPERPRQWKAYVRTGENAEPVPLGQIDALLQRRRDGKELPLPLTEDNAAKGIFLSREKVELEEGIYDVVLTIRLSRDVLPELRLASQIIVERAWPMIILEIDVPGLEEHERSTLKEEINPGELGDKDWERDVAMNVRLGGVEQPCDIKVQVINLVDAKNQPIHVPLVQPTRKQLALSPGRPTRLDLHFQVPEDVGDLENGMVKGELQFLRADTNEPLEVVPHDPKIGGTPSRGIL